MPLFAVVRIKGTVNVRHDMRITMDLLNIRRKFWASVVPGTDSYMGMLEKVKDFVTYGEIDRETLKLLILKRGVTRNGEKITDEIIRRNTNYSGVDEFVDALISGNAKLNDFSWIKPYFRLTPPKGGFKKSTKRPFSDGGELGYRGSNINELLRRMI